MLSFFETDAGKVALGGVIAFVSQIVVFVLSWIKDFIATKTAEGKEARFLAIRVVVTLEELVAACCDVVTDPTRRNENGEAINTVSIPDVKLPHDGEYRCFPTTIMYEVMSMPNRLASIKKGANWMLGESSRPENSEYFIYRQVEISKFGLSALDQISALQAKYKIPMAEQAEHYNPRELFEEALGRGSKNAYL